MNWAFFQTHGHSTPDFIRIGVDFKELTEKVGRVQIFGWEFFRKLSQYCRRNPNFPTVLRK